MLGLRVSFFRLYFKMSARTKLAPSLFHKNRLKCTNEAAIGESLEIANSDN